MGIGIILDIIVIGLLVLSIWLGYKKGLTKSLLKIFSFLIAIIISFILFSPISNFIINNTEIVNNLQNTIANTFKNEDEENKKNKELNNNLDEQKNESNNSEEENVENKELQITKEQEETSEKDFKNIFNKYIEKKIIEAGNEAKDYVIELASRQIAIVIVNICVFIILFIVVRIALIFIKALADAITKIPGIKQCDELLGGIYGGMRACIIILAIFTILSIIVPIFQLDFITDFINQSIISKFLYENNIILKMIL